MFRTKQSLQHVLKRIDEAEDDEIMEIIKSLVHWQNARYSEYEMVVISLPKFDMEKRFQQIDIMADFLKKHTDTRIDNSDRKTDCHTSVRTGSQ